LSRCIHSTVRRTVEREAGSAKSRVPGLGSSSAVPEHVPVKGVGNIKFEQNDLTFTDSGALDDGKIVVHIAGTSPIAESGGQVAIDKPPSVSQRYRAGVNQRGAIDDGRIVCRVKNEGPVRIFEASAVKVRSQARRPICR